MQNYLMEYYTMIDFIRPRLLGSRQEFSNRYCLEGGGTRCTGLTASCSLRFANPIENGQCADSMPEDVALMKRRSYVLSKKVASLVHRCSHHIIADTLPPKHESIIAIKLTPVQVLL
jgi:transcriptional regulator ATRX